MKTVKCTAECEELKSIQEYLKKISTIIVMSLMGWSCPAQNLTQSLAQTDGLTRESRPPHATYWSKQLGQHFPPSPFNPFPDLALYEISEGQFMYDDTGVDYRAMWATQKAAYKAASPAPKAKNPAARGKMLGVGQNSDSGLQFAAMDSSGPPPLPDPTNAPPYNPPPNPLPGTNIPGQLRLILGPGGTNALQMFGLQTGTRYYIVGKQDISPNIDNPWYFLGTFTASATNMTAYIHSTNTTEFYMLWPGEYTGPRLAVNYPTNGATVSGEITAQICVNDVSPVSLYVYLNGQPLTSVGELLVDVNTALGVKHSGTPDLKIPTDLLRNGENHITIVAMNHGVEVTPDTTNALTLGNLAYFSTSHDITVYAQNNFSLFGNPAMTSIGAGSAVHQVEVTGPGTVTLDVYDLDGNLCQSTSRTVTDANGAIVTLPWNLTNANGSAYTNSAYAAGYSFSASGGGGSQTRWLTNRVDTSTLISGSPLFTYMELEEAWWLNDLADDVFQNLYDFFDWAIPTLYYSASEIGQNRTHPVKWKFNIASMVNDVTWFHRYMTNSNFDTWVYLGHCNQQFIAFPGTSNPTGPDVISANAVAGDLGNYYGPGNYAGYVRYNRRLRTVTMQGCWSANINGMTNGGSPPVITEWPSATGTPPGVDQTLNRLYKTAFVGFEHMVSPQPTFIEALYYDWPHPELQIPNAPIVDSVAFALDFAWESDTAYIQSTGPKVLGFAWLPYRTIYDSQLRTNNFSSIDFFWW